MDALIQSLAEETIDPGEETFLLFSQPIPSQNLGFVDPKASSLSLTVAGRDFTIHQSPSVLSSSRAGGTTGAVLWKITPRFADWLASPTNVLFQSGLLGPASSALELGCGISALTALAAAPRMTRYVLSDQNYVSRLVEQNLAENQPAVQSPAKSRAKSRKPKAESPATLGAPVIEFIPLDWELDEVTPALTGCADVGSFDAVIACDCIYNDALIQPLIQTCVDACRLRDADPAKSEPCVCVVAQQLRNPEVFEAWLTAFHSQFRVWRLDDSLLPEDLGSGSGFVVHIGFLRDHFTTE